MACSPRQQAAVPIAQSRTALSFAVMAVVTALAASLALIFVFGIPLLYDCAIMLDCGRLLLMGRVPYVDYVEINPPMAHYIHCLPVLLAKLTNGNIALSFQASVLFLSIYSSVALFLVVSRLSPEFSLSERLFLVATWQSFSILLMLWTLFGEKEHMFILAYVPWLYCRVARYCGVRVPKGLSASIGLVAGPFILSKPHFCLLAGVMEAWMLLRSRRAAALWTNEVLLVAGWAIMYATHFLFIPAEMREAFFTRWLPFVAANYDVYGSPIGSVLMAMLRPKVLFVTVSLMSAIVALAAVPNMSIQERRQIETLTFGLLLAYGMYIVQLKGWTYHLIPAMGFAVLLFPTLVIVLLELPATGKRFLFARSGRLRVPMFCAGCLALMLICASMMLLSLRFHGIPARSDAIVPAIRAYTGQADCVLVISTSVESAYPALIQENRLPGTRYLQTFPIAMLYKGVRAEPGRPFPYRAAGERPKEEERFLDEMGSDVLKYRPKLIIINTQALCHGCPSGFRVDEYLSSVGWMERFLKDYTFLGNIPDSALYLRRD